MEDRRRASRRVVEKHLGSLEAMIMRVLWERPDLSVREVVQALPKGRPRAYTTVMTVMNRLTEKGLLERYPAGRAYLYRPRLSESDFVERITRQMVRALISDFGEVAVAQFVGELKDLDPQQFERLRRLLSG